MSNVCLVTSRGKQEDRIKLNLERAAKKYGWSDEYVRLKFELLTCHDTDGTDHAELLETLEAEYERMTRS